MNRQSKREPKRFPALFGFAYDPVASAAFGSLPTFDFRVESLGDAYFM